MKPRAGHDSYGNVLAQQQRRIRVFAFGYTGGSDPGKSGCVQYAPNGQPEKLAAHDAASSPGLNLQRHWLWQRQGPLG